MHCRKMSPSDLESVLEIQNELAFQNWTIKQLESECSSPLSISLVLIINEQVLGYLFIQVIGDEAELLSIAIKSDYSRRGAGSFLWQEGLSALKEKNVRTVFLEVRENNITAQQFYKKHGFICCGLRKRYYSDGENALLFRFDF